MDDQKISQLTQVSSLSGAELVPIVQSGLTVVTTTAQLWQNANNLAGATQATGLQAGDVIPIIRNGTVYLIAASLLGAATTSTPITLPDGSTLKDQSGNNITLN